MEWAHGSEAFLVSDYPGTSLRRGQCVIIIASYEHKVLVEVIDAMPGEHVISMPKSLLTSLFCDNENTG